MQYIVRLFEPPPDREYIALLKAVRSSLKNQCTKGEIKFVTNRIINSFRSRQLFGENIVNFDVSTTPTHFPGHTRGEYHSVVRLNKGLSVYYGLAYA